MFLEHFMEISRIPRGSGNRKPVSDFMMEFAEKNGLDAQRDRAGNVMICRKSSQNDGWVILQGHLDMVCEQKAGVNHDFQKDGIRVLKEDGYIRADGTTLGADDGIGVSYMMSLLTDDWEEAHLPSLACLFTVDEEIGLLGAAELQLPNPGASYLINLDNEAEHHICMSCAGGVTLQLDGKTSAIGAGREVYPLKIKVSNCLGGHSGTEIIQERANAVKILARLLNGLKHHLQTPDGNAGAIRLVSFEGGNKDNAIPNFARAEILLDSKTLLEQSLAYLENYRGEILHEYEQIDDGMEIQFHGSERFSRDTIKCFPPSLSNDMIFLLNQIPDGVDSMEHKSPVLLVSSSSNLGIARLDADNGEIHLSVSVRSNVNSKKQYLCERICDLACQFGLSVSREGDYPGWEMKTESRLRELADSCHQKLYGRKPVWEALHAGLECGILADRFPGLDMISIGPNLVGVHTANERMEIASAESTFDYLKHLLYMIADDSHEK